jgi:hypothetical protein
LLFLLIFYHQRIHSNCRVNTVGIFDLPDNITGTCTTKVFEYHIQYTITFSPIMSMKLVRKFLQQDQVEDSTPEGLAKRRLKVKRRRKRAADKAEKSISATEDDVVEATINNILFLDQAMVNNNRNNNKNDALKRINDKSKKIKKIRKKSESMPVIGNSRSSSSQLRRLPSEPTIDKKRHRKEMEDKQLEKIAKLLSKKMKKSKK